MSDEILKEILAELRKLNENSKPRLWDICDIADYFKVSRTTVSQKFIAQPSFPRAISVMESHPRWLPERIIDWAKRQ